MAGKKTIYTGILEKVKERNKGIKKAGGGEAKRLRVVTTLPVNRIKKPKG